MPRLLVPLVAIAACSARPPAVASHGVAPTPDAGVASDAAVAVVAAPPDRGPPLAECPPEAHPGPRQGAQWSPIAVVTDAASPGAWQADPTAVFLADGVVALAYVAGDDGIGFARLAQDGTVTATGAIAGRAASPELARLVNGDLLAVWQRDQGIGRALSSDGGRTWTEAPLALDPGECGDGAPCATAPRLVATRLSPPRGTRLEQVHLAYRTAAGIRLRVSSDGGHSFGAPVTAPLDGDFDLAVDGAGGAHLVAIAGDGPDARTVAYSHAPDGTRFTAPVTVSAAGDPIPRDFARPEIVVEVRRGRVHIAYLVGADTAWNLWLATSTDRGQSWTRHRIVGTDPPCANHAVPTLFLRGTGNVALSWFEYVDGAGYRAYTGCERDGASCKAPQPLGPPMADYQLGPRSPRWLGTQSVLITDDDRRRRHALWTQVIGEGDGGTARIVWSTASGR